MICGETSVFIAGLFIPGSNLVAGGIGQMKGGGSECSPVTRGLTHERALLRVDAGVGGCVGFIGAAPERGPDHVGKRRCQPGSTPTRFRRVDLGVLTAEQLRNDGHVHGALGEKSEDAPVGTTFEPDPSLASMRCTRLAARCGGSERRILVRLRGEASS